jgi:hypothetical protein
VALDTDARRLSCRAQVRIASGHPRLGMTLEHQDLAPAGLLDRSC